MCKLKSTGEIINGAYNVVLSKEQNVPRIASLRDTVSIVEYRCRAQECDATGYDSNTAVWTIRNIRLKYLPQLINNIPQY